MKKDLYQQSLSYLEKICLDIGQRPVGSKNNIKATGFFAKEIANFGWQVEKQKFQAFDWQDFGASLKSEKDCFKVFVSPYSNGIEIEAELIAVKNLTELKKVSCKQKILLLHSDITKEQLMPKNFVFYNPQEHKEIIALLEKKQPLAIIAATNKNSSVAGGVYPFPFIEDGDFDIPSVYMTDKEAKKLFKYIGKKVYLKSIAKRTNSKGFNVIAKKGLENKKKIVITAHIDTKKDTAGAIDNATGIVILLLLARLLKEYRGNKQLEIVAFNGEDYFSAPGQMHYIKENANNFKHMILNINIDGAAYKTGKSCFSFFDLPQNIQKEANQILQIYKNIVETEPWPQGDHSIFVQNLVPAIAVSSEWLIKNMDKQNITHTQRDNLKIVDADKLLEIAKAIAQLIQNI